jgi:hypothetical protein
MLRGAFVELAWDEKEITQCNGTNKQHKERELFLTYERFQCPIVLRVALYHIVMEIRGMRESELAVAIVWSGLEYISVVLRWEYAGRDRTRTLK